MKRKALSNGRPKGPPAETAHGRPKRRLTMAAMPNPPHGTLLTISLEEAARHVDMTPRALLRWLETLDAACLIRLSARRRRIDRRGFFKLLERKGFEGPRPGGAHAR